MSRQTRIDATGPTRLNNSNKKPFQKIEKEEESKERSRRKKKKVKKSKERSKKVEDTSVTSGRRSPA